MGHVADAQALKSLEHDVTAAVELLRTLTKSAPSHLVGKSQRLPTEELQLAQGIAFVFATKLGFIASAVTGHGFMIKRLPTSATGWSAPILFDVKAVGVGASAGFSKSSTLLVLDTEHRVNDFLHMQASLDTDVTVAAGPAGRKMHGSEFNLSHPTDTFEGASYSVAHGAMIDVSFQGVTLAVKRHAMHQLYGEGTPNKDVLAGTVPALPVVEPLYSELQLAQRGGAIPTSTVA